MGHADLNAALPWLETLTGEGPVSDELLREAARRHPSLDLIAGEILLATPFDFHVASKCIILNSKIWTWEVKRNNTFPGIVGPILQLLFGNRVGIQFQRSLRQSVGLQVIVIIPAHLRRL